MLPFYLEAQVPVPMFSVVLLIFLSLLMVILVVSCFVKRRVKELRKGDTAKRAGDKEMLKSDQIDGD